MTAEWVFNLYVFVLATFVGYQVISRVPPLLHTPLMSGTNAISGISLVASLLAAGSHHRLSQILGFVAVTCASINVVGGFLITDRMLRMFRKRSAASPQGAAVTRPLAAAPAASTDNALAQGKPS
jgi:NAD(P) transhydrogenase subunit alpha